MIELRHYVTASGKNLFEEWLDSLKDAKTQAKIAARIARLAAGNFGDCKPLRDGVWELRIDWGPGYRIYYADDRSDVRVIVLRGRQAQAIGGH